MDIHTQMAILKATAQSEGVQVPDDVLYYLAENSMATTRRDLEGILIRAIAYASLTGQPMTIALVRDVLTSVHSSDDVKALMPGRILGRVNGACLTWWIW